MSKLEIQTDELKALEPSKADAIRKVFMPMADMLDTFEEKYNEVIASSKKEITKESVAVAKRLRLDISRVRIDADKARKSQKEEYLRAGRAIDGACNILKWAVIEKENKLEDIENHFAKIEEEKLAKIEADKKQIQEDRVKMLSKFIDDASERNLSDMDDDVFDAYLTTKENAYHENIRAEEKRLQEELDAKLEKERLAEEKRLQDIVDAKRETQEKADLLAKELADQKIIDDKLALENEEKLKEEKVKAEEKAKKDKIASDKKHEVELKKAKVQAEKDALKKVEDAKKIADAEMKKKKDNLENRKVIHEGIKQQLIYLGVEDSLAVKVIMAMSKSEIENVSIQY